MQKKKKKIVDILPAASSYRESLLINSFKCHKKSIMHQLAMNIRPPSATKLDEKLKRCSKI